MLKLDLILESEKSYLSKKNMKRLFKYFLQGLLLLGPLVLTLYSVFLMFNYVDRLIGDPLKEHYQLDIPGIGIVVLFISLTLLGLIGQTIIARPFISLTKRILARTPLLNVIYTSLQDLFTAFVGKEKKFNIPVMVCMNQENDLWKLGFITEKNMQDFGFQDKVAVYFPHSYAFSGVLYIVPEKSVKPVNLSPSEVMKFIVSGGVTKVN
ncbi:MAG: DUF502 domain-containing protein [Prolixibacteraceae bacterium]